VDAISEDGAGAVNVNPAVCIGCGLCAFECPVSALSLQQIHPASFIPA
jgi:Fe-S-cluster-containing hydrogenase component 2